jgi:hypothetical protein
MLPVFASKNRKAPTVLQEPSRLFSRGYGTRGRPQACDVSVLFAIQEIGVFFCSESALESAPGYHMGEGDSRGAYLWDSSLAIRSQAIVPLDRLAIAQNRLQSNVLEPGEGQGRERKDSEASRQGKSVLSTPPATGSLFCKLSGFRKFRPQSDYGHCHPRN